MNDVKSSLVYVYKTGPRAAFIACKAKYSNEFYFRKFKKSSNVGIASHLSFFLYVSGLSVTHSTDEVLRQRRLKFIEAGYFRVGDTHKRAYKTTYSNQQMVSCSSESACFSFVF